MLATTTIQTAKITIMENPFNEKIDFTQIDNITTSGTGVDKYIMTADYRGVEMTDDQVEYINEHYSEFVQEYPIY